LSLELLLAGAMVVSLNLYVLLGGADYGGGVWDLFARGPRLKQQRNLIARAIGPIWEANHVWLILVVVIFFTAFPLGFATIGTALHIPLTLLLIGIVLRGSAFTFRTYDSQRDSVQQRWSRLFSIASAITPFMLGLIVGAIASGQIQIDTTNFEVTFIRPWLSPFAFAVGFFALSLFAFIAAVYLTLETNDRALQDDFRLRAIISGVAVGVFALIVFVLSGAYATQIRAGISATAWAIPLHLSTAICAIGAFVALWKRSYRLARLLAAGQVSLILWGWALAQYPFIVGPNVTIYSAGSRRETLELLVVALCGGAMILFPSFFYLFHVFKGRTAFAAQKRKDSES
jgi:cytochrome bd ubiquinol oxidase subunit II